MAMTDTPKNPALRGRQAADRHYFVFWIFLGFFWWLLAPLIAYFTRPQPSAADLALGPSDSGELAVFITAYTARARSRRITRAWIGVGLFCLLMSYGVIRSLTAGPFGDGSERAGVRLTQTQTADAPDTGSDRASPLPVEPAAAPPAVAPVTRAVVVALIDEYIEASEQALTLKTAAADAIGDEWEKRWAHDAVTMDRFTFEKMLEQVRGQLAYAESTGDLSAVYENALYHARQSQDALAAAEAAAEAR